MSKIIALIGTLDTKGEEFAFIKAAIKSRGQKAMVINVGIMGEPQIHPYIGAKAVASAGGSSLHALREKADRGYAIAVMTRGAAVVVHDLFEQGIISGVLGMGGAAGTAIATAAMRELPVGFPKVMVSTLAAADTAAYVGSKDIAMIPAVIEASGVNPTSEQIYANAVGAIVGMVETAAAAVEEQAPKS